MLLALKLEVCRVNLRHLAVKMRLGFLRNGLFSVPRESQRPCWLLAASYTLQAPRRRQQAAAQGAPGSTCESCTAVVLCLFAAQSRGGAAGASAWGGCAVPRLPSAEPCPGRGTAPGPASGCTCQREQFAQLWPWGWEGRLWLLPRSAQLSSQSFVAETPRVCTGGIVPAGTAACPATVRTMPIPQVVFPLSPKRRHPNVLEKMG